MPPARLGTYGPYPQGTEIPDFLASALRPVFATHTPEKIPLIPKVQKALAYMGVFTIDDMRQDGLSQGEFERSFSAHVGGDDALVMLRLVLKHAGEFGSPLKLPQKPATKGAHNLNFQSPEAGSSRSTASHGGKGSSGGSEGSRASGQPGSGTVPVNFPGAVAPLRSVNGSGAMPPLELEHLKRFLAPHGFSKFNKAHGGHFTKVVGMVLAFLINRG
jgi:hypothetical protein